ncbi:hypothetical protein ACJ8PQ_24150, partial [Serratia sp. CY74664]
MPVEKKKGISRLTYSIRNSWAGFIDAVLTEDAFRQLLVINAILLVVTELPQADLALISQWMVGRQQCMSGQ